MRLLPLLVSSLLMSAALAQDLLAEAQIEVRNRLRVPGSAQFDNFRAAQKTVNDKKAQVVCGNVNAKNSAGQLAGSSPFVFLGESRESWLARNYDILKDGSKDQDAGARVSAILLVERRVQHHTSHSEDARTVRVLKR